MAQPQGFGAALKRYRRAAGLTQEALAERAGYSTVYISMLERGERLPVPATVDLLAGALALSPRDRAALHAAAPRQAGATGERSAVSGPPLVGRARELERLERHLREQGAPLLLLAGEPGIGKTRLLREAAVLAREAGCTVLQGGCQRRGGQEPYAPTLGALKEYIRVQPPEQLREDLRGCAWLVRLLPELADAPIEPLPAWTLSPGQERRMMFDAVARFLANVAGPGGTALLLDDLHWADLDALELIVMLCHGASAPPLRLIGAYRDTEVRPSDAISTVLADLAHAGLAARCPVPPLAPDEAALLFDRLYEDAALAGGEAREQRDETRERVVRRTGGVPFFVVSYAQGLRLSPAPENQAEGIPWEVAQGLRQRVAALPATAREVLGVAATMGRRATRRALLAAVAAPEEEVLAALEAACAARLLVEDGTDAYQFAHDLVREVVESDLGGARRAMLHRRIAQALEREPGAGAVEALAYHYARGDDPEKAVVYLERAGDQARSMSAQGLAEGYYRELVDRLDGLGRALEAAGAREKLGAVLRVRGRLDAALETLEQAEAAYHEAGDLEGVVRVVTVIAGTLGTRGTPQAGVERIQPLLERLEAAGSEPDSALADLYATLAHLYFVAGRYGEQIAAAERAVALARRAGDGRILTEAMQRHGLGLIMAGRSEQGVRVLLEMVPLAEASGNLTSLGLALNSVAVVYQERGDFARCLPYAERALETATRRGDPLQIILMTCNQGITAYYMGDWPRARADYARALEISRASDLHFSSMYPVLLLGQLAQLEGETEEAARYLDEGLAMAEQRGDAQALRAAYTYMAERDLALGQPRAARERLLALLARPDLEEASSQYAQLLLARADLALGYEAAERGARAGLARVRAGDSKLELVEALYTLALVALRREQWEEAARALEEGLALTRAMPYPHGEARLLRLAALLHHARGESQQAHEHLAEAVALFNRLGARPEAEQAAALP